MKEDLIQFLESFGVLTPDEVAIITEHTNVERFKKKTLLLREGEIAKNCFAVLKGCVREYYVKDGTEKTIAFYTEGDPIGSFSSAAQNKPSLYTLECMEDCTLTVSTQSLEDEMCQRIPRLEGIIRQEVEKNTGQLQDRLATFITSSPEERFLDLLERNPKLINRVPQHQIASYLGITPESLSRIKKRLYTSPQ